MKADPHGWRQRKKGRRMNHSWQLKIHKFYFSTVPWLHAPDFGTGLIIVHEYVTFTTHLGSKQFILRVIKNNSWVSVNWFSESWFRYAELIAVYVSECVSNVCLWLLVFMSAFQSLNIPLERYWSRLLCVMAHCDWSFLCPSRLLSSLWLVHPMLQVHRHESAEKPSTCLSLAAFPLSFPMVLSFLPFSLSLHLLCVGW